MIQPFLKFQEDHSLALSPELEDFLAQETACRTYSLAQLSQDLQSTLAAELKPERYAKHQSDLKRLMVTPFLLLTVGLMVIKGLINFPPTRNYTTQEEYENERHWGEKLVPLFVLSCMGRFYIMRRMAKIQAYRRRHAELATPVLEAATRHYAATSGSSSSTTNKYQPVFVYREAGFWQSCASVEVLSHPPIKGNEGGVPLAEDYHQMA